MSEQHDLGCELALKRLVEFVDRELPVSENDSVEQHLRICRNCCSRAEFERQLKQRLSSLPSEEAPAAARDRVRDLIKRF